MNRMIGDIRKSEEDAKKSLKRKGQLFSNLKNTILTSLKNYKPPVKPERNYQNEIVDIINEESKT